MSNYYLASFPLKFSSGDVARKTLETFREHMSNAKQCSKLEDVVADFDNALKLADATDKVGYHFSRSDVDVLSKSVAYAKKMQKHHVCSPLKLERMTLSGITAGVRVQASYEAKLNKKKGDADINDILRAMRDRAMRE